MIEFKIKDHFDPTFFSNFIDCRHQYYLNFPFYEREELGTFETLLGKGLFPEQKWLALLLIQNQKTVARALICQNSTNPDILKVGFLEFPDDFELFQILWQKIENLTQGWGVKKIKAPIDFHFFFRYRLTLHSERPFWGEPIQPSYHKDFFEKMGLQICKKWKSFEIRYTNTTKTFNQIKEKYRPDKSLKLRPINMDRFDEELEILHRLFTASFAQMSEYENISLLAFKALFSDFRYIAHPKFSYIIEREGVPVAFGVNYFDPLSLLIQKQKWETNGVWGGWRRLWLGLRLKFNWKRLMIIYVGKLPEMEGVKGIQSLISPMLSKQSLIRGVLKADVCYVAEDSPSQKSFRSINSRIISEYALFSKPHSHQ